MRFLAVVGVVLVGAVAQAAPRPTPFLMERLTMHESYSGVTGPKYEKIVADLQALTAAYPKWVDYVPYGVTVQGRTLSAVRIWDHQPRAQVRKTVVISGATHGDEYLGFEEKMVGVFMQSSQRLPGWQRFINQGGVLIYIPILNPDGYASVRRTNANGLDLNRDFSLKQFPGKGLTQPETKQLAAMVHSSLQQVKSVLSVSMDYHCCIGALLYPYSYARPTPPVVPPANIAAMRAVGELMHTIFQTKYPYGQTPDILGYDAIGTTKDFYYENYNGASFTFEGEGGGKDKLEDHVRFWDGIFSKVSATPAEWWFEKH